MRILSLNNFVSSAISSMKEQVFEGVSPQVKKVGIVALAIFMMCMCLVGISLIIKFKGRRLADTADKLRKGWKLEEATKKFEEALKSDPNNMSNLTRYAKTLNESKKQNEALQQITKVVEHHKKAIEKYPNDSQALREYAKAIFLEFQIKEDWWADDLLHGLNVDLEKSHEEEKTEQFLEKFKEILQYLKKAIEIDPKDITALRLSTKIFWIQSGYESTKNIIDYIKNDIKNDFKKDLQKEPTKEDYELLKNNMELLTSLNLSWDNLENQKYCILILKRIVALENDRFPKWLERIKAIVAIAPKDPRVLKDYAIALKYTNQFDEAQQQLEKILALYPKDFHAMYQLGLAFYKKNDLESAEKWLIKCLEIQPRYIKAIKYHGIILEKLEKPEEASKQYQKALEIRPGDIKALLLNKAVLKDLNKPEEVLKQYERALEIRPNDIDILLLYGEFLQAMDKLEEASKQYKKALEIRPDDARFLSRYGNVLKKINTYNAEKRKQDLQTLEEGTLEFDVNYFLSLRGYNELNEFDPAIEKYENALKIRPNDLEILLNYGDFLRLIDKLEEASKQYKKGLEIRPDDVRFLSRYGDVLRSLKEFDPAIEKYENALKLRPDDLKILFHYGDFLRFIDKLEEASQLYEKALENRPDDVDCLSRYGDILANLKGYDAAIEQYDKALKLDPKNKSILYKKEESLRKKAKGKTGMEKKKPLEWPLIHSLPSK